MLNLWKFQPPDAAPRFLLSRNDLEATAWTRASSSVSVTSGPPRDPGCRVGTLAADRAPPHEVTVAAASVFLGSSDTREGLQPQEKLGPVWGDGCMFAALRVHIIISFNGNSGGDLSWRSRAMLCESDAKASAAVGVAPSMPLPFLADLWRNSRERRGCLGHGEAFD